MSSGAQQLIADFEQVQKMLEMYPDIKIIKTAGDPPDQYDIEYTIKGYRTNPDGTASPDNKHEVHITLPFGYPHFPPTAKPITPIFHPDIDPDAIRIADFWQDNHSLADLIVHIGQMICGNHYTREEPFNQNAYDWFEERKSWLPFDILEPREEDETAGTSASEAETGQTFAPATDLDILKDDIDFPFDEDEESGEEFSFDIDEDSPAEDLTGLEAEESGDDIAFDLDDEDASGLFDLSAPGGAETPDIFSLETDEIPDDLSFDLADEPETVEPGHESLPTDGLFDLDSEESTEGAETKLEFDSDDMTSAFDEESFIEPEASGAVDITLDDLAGLEEEETSLDFGIAEESPEAGEGTTADLSSLEEKMAEIDETAGDEEKILSALSLDAEFASAGKPTEQSGILRSLIEQKQIFSAKKVLAELPDPDSLPDREELELTIAGAVSEAEELYTKADKHEQKGEFEKAGILLDLVANIAVDFPGLDFARNRIRDSMMGQGRKEGEEAADQKTAEQSPQDKPDKSEGKKTTKKKKSRARRRFKVPARLISILLLIILLGGIGAGMAYVYQSDSANIKLAGSTFQKAEQLVDRKEFKQAQIELDAATSALDKVVIFQGPEKNSLENKIQGLTSSSLFKEGLQGRVLYGDQYVSVERARAIDKFNTQKSYAEQVLKGGKLDLAINAYEKSLPLAEKAGFAEQVESITYRLNELRLETAMAQAKQYEEQLDWHNVAKAYQNALDQSRKISSPEVQNDIANRLATSSYRYNRKEGLKAIKSSEWQESIDALLAAQTILKANPQIVPDPEKTEISRLLIQSRLYFMLGEARKAYENREWDVAVETYNDAVDLLSKNKDLLGQEAEDNVRKIRKTILTTHIAREQAQIASAKGAESLENTAEHYQAIVDMIEKSAFKDDETLARILDDARTRNTEIQNRLLVSKREKWLMDNYENIFRDSYPSAKLSELLNPKVRFIKRDGEIMIFNLSCRERKQGSFFRLELNYQYDLEEDTWSLYSGKIEDIQSE